MAKYRKRPVVVEAEQFDPERRPWPAGVELAPGTIIYKGEVLHIQARIGDTIVRPGDWIVTGIAGKKYSVKDAIFRVMYEPVEDGPEPWVERVAVPVWPSSISATMWVACPFCGSVLRLGHMEGCEHYRGPLEDYGNRLLFYAVYEGTPRGMTHRWRDEPVRVVTGGPEYYEVRTAEGPRLARRSDLRRVPYAEGTIILSSTGDPLKGE
jgi:hypothetical protein